MKLLTALTLVLCAGCGASNKYECLQRTQKEVPNSSGNGTHTAVDYVLLHNGDKIYADCDTTDYDKLDPSARCGFRPLRTYECAIQPSTIEKGAFPLSDLKCTDTDGHNVYLYVSKKETTNGNAVLPLAALIASLIAIAISAGALWKGHLAPFSPLAIAGNLGLRVYPIRSGSERWFISSFHIPLNVTNKGARPGCVTGARLRLHYPDLPIPGNYEFVAPKWELKPDKVNLIDKNRFEWIDKVMASDWSPFVILPKATIAKHLLLEFRWNEPVIQKRITATLELQVDTRKKWIVVSKWHLGMSPEQWSQLASEGGSFAYLAEGRTWIHSECSPPDLHKYTGTKAPIPKGGLNAEPSYLDYLEE